MMNTFIKIKRDHCNKLFQMIDEFTINIEYMVCLKERKYSNTFKKIFYLDSRVHSQERNVSSVYSNFWMCCCNVQTLSMQAHVQQPK